MGAIVNLKSAVIIPFRRPKRITLKYVVARAFAVKMFEVLCPCCSAFNRLPKSPRLIDQNNDWIFRCKECDQQMLYNPWRDKPKDGASPPVDQSKPDPINTEIMPREMFSDLAALIDLTGVDL